MYIYICVCVHLDECLKVQTKCQIPINEVPISQLPQQLESCEVTQLLLTVVENFYILFNANSSDITNKLWDNICLPPVKSVGVLVNTIWPTFLNKLVSFEKEVRQFTLTCNQGVYMLSSSQANHEVKRFVQGLRACKLIPLYRSDWIEEVIKKVRIYSGLRYVTEEAQSFIRVCKRLHLTGDFSVIENIAEVSLRFLELCLCTYIFIVLIHMQCEQILGIQPLSVITKKMEDIVTFLKGFSELSEIILELSECKLLVEWLQTDVKS